ncbi:WYL domain-containing protein [Heyndrickxia ginsengihumi]|uniref:WYL domain-containing protein n=1 Tax=Heyndrickxia ginsengihumi TaxID=363870 RepID=UPI003D19BD9F
MKGLLMRAAESGERLEMIYMSAKGDISQRVIKVLHVSSESLKAYCYTRNQFRTFKLENILSIVPLKQHRRGA